MATLTPGAQAVFGGTAVEQIRDLSEYYSLVSNSRGSCRRRRRLSRGSLAVRGLVEFGSGASLKTRVMLDGTSKFRCVSRSTSARPREPPFILVRNMY
jgi:uncharacterized SAM-dependent methyltransferase